jgi:hypothetical protein
MGAVLAHLPYCHLSWGHLLLHLLAGLQNEGW